MTPFKKILLLSYLSLGCILVLTGCGELKKTFNITSIDEDGTKSAPLNFPAKKLAMKGMSDYSVGKYFTALDFFNEILTKYPFSPEATLAELKAADCNYFLGHYMEALILYEEFENRHPTNESIPYIMFQKGMCNYKQIDRIDRDTTGAIKAVALFKQLLRAYPDTPYSDEARAKIATASEFLANHEFCVAEYYIRTGKYDQAKIRLQYLLANYPKTKISDKAQEVLAQIKAGNPPKSRLFSWFPRINAKDFPLFGDKDRDNSAAEELKR